MFVLGEGVRELFLGESDSVSSPDVLGTPVWLDMLSKMTIISNFIEYEVRCSRMVSNQMASTKVQLFSSI